MSGRERTSTRVASVTTRDRIAVAFTLHGAVVTTLLGCVRVVCRTSIFEINSSIVSPIGPNLRDCIISLSPGDNYCYIFTSLRRCSSNLWHASVQPLVKLYRDITVSAGNRLFNLEILGVSITIILKTVVVLKKKTIVKVG